MYEQYIFIFIISPVKQNTHRKNVHPLNICSNILLLLLFTQSASKRQKYYTSISRKITTITEYLNGSEGHSEQGEVNCYTGRGGNMGA